MSRRTLTVILILAGAQSRILSAGQEVGVVTTLAGTAGDFGYTNGAGNQALFESPKAMSTDKQGNIYIVDSYCGTLRKITPGGVVTTLAGPTPVMGCAFGSADGQGNAARFNSPSGTAVDSAGNVYVADSGNCTLRKVTPSGVVTTLAGSPNVCASVDGPQDVARFDPLAGAAVDASDNIWVTSWYGCTVRRVTQAGYVTTVAGVSGSCSSMDGMGTAARFNNPSGIAVDGDGNFFIADETGCTIRKLTPAGVVTTLAGEPDVCGAVDGTGNLALFNVPSWTAVDNAGNIYVSDYLNFTVRQVTPAGVVTTLAGLPLTPGSADGEGAAARFDHPDGVAVDRQGNVYVADRNNNTVRKIVIGLQFYPITPCRLVDTRGTDAGFNGIAPFSGPSIASGATLSIPVQSAAEASANTTPAPCGTIPSTAQAYSLNVTVVPHVVATDQYPGVVYFISLWPSGVAQPSVSTLNDTQGQILANAAIVPAGTPSGGISIYNAGPAAADVILDMNGYFAAPATQGSAQGFTTGLQFYPVSPCRLVDTRGPSAGFNGISPFSGPSLVSGATANIPVQSSSEATADTTPAPCGTIPSDAEAYSLNATLVPHAGALDHFITLWPSGLAQPTVSTLNDQQGEVVANAAIVPAGKPSGGVSLFNGGPAVADVILDMNGYFAAPSGLKFYPVSPCRLVDTRGTAAGFNGISPFSGPSIQAGAAITIPVQSASEAATNTTPAPCGTIPSTALAYSLNLTVAPKIVLTDAYPGAVDYITIWPAGSVQPVVSTLNDQEALVVANAAIVPAGSGSGGITVYNAGPSATDVVIDMNGYFAP